MKLRMLITSLAIVCMAGQWSFGTVGIPNAMAQSTAEAPVQEEKQKPSSRKIDKDKRDQMVAKAIRALKANQAEDGSWDSELSIGVTGLVVYSLLKNDIPPTDPMVSKGLAFLKSHVRPSGEFTRKVPFTATTKQVFRSSVLCRPIE